MVEFHMLMDLGCTYNNHAPGTVPVAPACRGQASCEAGRGMAPAHAGVGAGLSRLAC